MRVLLIEDEPKIAEFVVAGLGRMDIGVTHCEDGESGLQAFVANGFDVVVLDVMLPRINGFEVLQKIR